MAQRNRTDGALLGYSAAIAEAIGSDDDALIDLVEEFMRIEHSTLDALTRARFVHLARESLDDILAWHHGGPVNGTTLADYCTSFGLAYPISLTTRPTSQ